MGFSLRPLARARLTDALRADCLAQLGVPELAELFSFVWVTAATANASPSGVASAETECAVERAVVSAQRYVRSAVRKREEESAHAQPPPPPVASGDAGPSARSPVMLAVGRVLREATKALHQGVSDIAGAASSGIPAPIPKVQLRSSRDAGSGHAADDELVGQAGIATAVDMLSAEIQARRHFAVWPASSGSLTCAGAQTALSSLASAVTKASQLELASRGQSNTSAEGGEAVQALKLELQVRTAEADLRACFTARGRSVRRSLAVKRATLKRPTLRRGTATPLRCKSWVFCRTKSEGEPRAAPAPAQNLSLCALCVCVWLSDSVLARP